MIPTFDNMLDTQAVEYKGQDAPTLCMDSGFHLVHNWGYCPTWLRLAAGEREKAIMSHPQVKVVYLLNDEPTTERQHNHMPYIVSPTGRFQIDSKTQTIIG